MLVSDSRTGELVRKVVSFSDKSLALTKRQRWAAALKEKRQQEDSGMTAEAEAGVPAALGAVAPDEIISTDGPSQRQGPVATEEDAKMTIFIGDS